MCDEFGHTKFPFSYLTYVTLLTPAQAHLSCQKERGSGALVSPVRSGIISSGFDPGSHLPAIHHPDDDTTKSGPRVAL
jgi:hypothetical protein